MYVSGMTLDDPDQQYKVSLGPIEITRNITIKPHGFGAGPNYDYNYDVFATISGLANDGRRLFNVNPDTKLTLERIRVHSFAALNVSLRPSAAGALLAGALTPHCPPRTVPRIPPPPPPIVAARQVGSLGSATSVDSCSVSERSLQSAPYISTS